MHQLEVNARLESSVTAVLDCTLSIHSRASSRAIGKRSALPGYGVIQDSIQPNVEGELKSVVDGPRSLQNLHTYTVHQMDHPRKASVF